MMHPTNTHLAMANCTSMPFPSDAFWVRVFVHYLSAFPGVFPPRRVFAAITHAGAKLFKRWKKGIPTDR